MFFFVRAGVLSLEGTWNFDSVNRERGIVLSSSASVLLMEIFNDRREIALVIENCERAWENSIFRSEGSYY